MKIFRVITILLFGLILFSHCKSSHSTPTASVPYTLTFNGKDADGGGPMASQSVKSGESIILPANGFSKTGYTFVGWTTDETSNSAVYKDQASFTMGSNDITLYAIWGQTRTFKLCSNSECALKIEKTFGEGYTDNFMDIIDTPFTNTGQAFQCWASNSASDCRTGTHYANGASFTMGSSDMTLYAIWTPDFKTITFNINDDPGSGTTVTQNIALNSSAKLTANSFSNNGWTFAGWSESPNGSVKYANSASFTMGSSDMPLYAIWSGIVSTLAGGNGFSGDGYADGTGTDARFYAPNGITYSGGFLYVADTNNHAIRKLDIASGTVSTLAGSGTAGSADGTGPGASFNSPRGITKNGSYLYVADTGNNTIRRIDISTGIVSTIGNATFNWPSGITTDGNYLYITDKGNKAIRKIEISTGAVSTLDCHDDSTGTSTTFNGPNGITTDNTSLYITDNYIIRKIVISTGAVSTLAGNGTAGSADGTGTAASFNYPSGITIDSGKTYLYVADTNNNKIRKIAISDGKVTTIAGGGAQSDSPVNGLGTVASFSYPTGIAFDSDHTYWYIADTLNHQIRKMSQN